MTVEESNAATLRRIYEAYAGGDHGPLLDALAPDARFRIHASCVRGDHCKQAMDRIAQDYEWEEFGCFDVICQDDRAVGLTGGRIKHRETGVAMDLDLVDVVRFRDGKIAEFATYFDSNELLARQGSFVWVGTQAERARLPAAMRAGLAAAEAKVKAARVIEVVAEPKAKAAPKAKTAPKKAKPAAKAAPKAKASPKAKAKAKTKRRPDRRR